MARFFLLFFLALLGSGYCQVRGLAEVHQTRALQTTVLTANTGWQTLYSQKIKAHTGDVLLITGQAQLTLDSTSTVGQQFRLTVNGRPVGTQAIEFNDQPGSHHLPMLVTALLVAGSDEEVLVKAEASTFHSDGNFPVTVDYADNMKYGSLTVQQYRDYPSWESASEARFVREVHWAPEPTQERVCSVPYRQESVGDIVLDALEPGDILWLSGQTVGVARWGLEMMAGVLTADEKAVSPYGGQNVASQNLFAPLHFEGFSEAQAEHTKLEWRVYGGFGRGMTLYPSATRFEAFHFARRGQRLESFGQRAISNSRIPSNAGMQELVGRDIELERGDLLRLAGMAQFGKPEFNQPITLECRARVRLTGPDGERSSFSQKNLTGTKPAVPLAAFLTARIEKPGTYRMSLMGSGHTDVGAVRMVLDAEHSQLQFIHFR